MKRQSGFGLPGPVRRTRTWWLREAQWHMAMAWVGCHPAHNRLAASRARGYAVEIVRRWHADGKKPSHITTDASLVAQTTGHRLSLARIGATYRASMLRRVSP